jgi:predicted Zn-dependent protease
LNRFLACIAIAVFLIAAVRCHEAAAQLAGAQPSRQQAASDAATPAFLPSYYTPALKIPGIPLHLADHEEKDHQSRYVYVSDDQVVSLTVESIKCDSTLCNTVYNNAAAYVDEEVTKNSDNFRVATPTEFRADWTTGLGNNFLFVFRLPSMLLFWTYSSRLDRTLDIDHLFELVKALSNRKRYDDALAEGNVELGHWDAQIRDWARSLLQDGRKPDAIAVFKKLLETTPFDYQAHLDLMENSDNAADARDSAKVVLDNAEDPIFIAKAMHFLGLPPRSIEDLPPLTPQDRGLQLILIPLNPCNVRFLEKAAPIYERITAVPIKIRRLPDSWNWGASERIANEKNIRQTIIQNSGPSVDFSGWTKQKYESELLATVASKSALAKFSMQSFAEKLKTAPGQYLVDNYLDELADLLEKYRSDDRRTMYVGVTEANIYSGDSNYVFSLFTQKKGHGVSLLSYSMMMAKMTGETYESQSRLAERIAKELVPASLKALDIPRPTDPSDPYSYASGLDRLSQKGLVLSEPVRAALDKFRESR